MNSNGDRPGTVRDRALRMVLQYPPGRLLPTDTDTADMVGASVRTIRRCMHEFAEQGLVKRIRGKGTYRAGKLSSAETIHGTGHSVVENIRRTILDSIARGEIRLGQPLPLVKRVALHYKVHPSSVISAYRELCCQGLVEQIGKRYWLGTFREVLKEGGGRRVLVVASGDEVLESLYSTHELNYAFRRMEYVLHSSGFVLEYITKKQFLQKVDEYCTVGPMPFGLVLAGINAEEYVRLEPFLDRLVKSAGSFRPSVLLLARSGAYPVSRSYVQPLWYHGSTLTALSRELACTARERKYSRITLFFDSSVPNVHSAKAYLKIRSEVRHLAPGIEFRYRLKADTPNPPLFSVIRSKLAIPILCKYEQEDRENVLKDCVAVRDLFDTLPRPKSGEAWVFCRTEDAVKALDYCRMRRIEVPDDVALIGLTNEPGYHRHGITTCVEDWDRIGYLMAHAIIGDMPIERSSRGFIRTPAVFLERQTT